GRIPQTEPIELGEKGLGRSRWRGFDVRVLGRLVRPQGQWVTIGQNFTLLGRRIARNIFLLRFDIDWLRELRFGRTFLRNRKNRRLGRRAAAHKTAYEQSGDKRNTKPKAQQLGHPSARGAIA